MPAHQVFQPQQPATKAEVLALHHKLHQLRSSGSSCSSLQSLSLTTTNDSCDARSPSAEAAEPVKPLPDFFSQSHVTPKTTSILRPGAVFIGTQQSGRSTYEVRVELKYVDLDQSLVCGYINIKGLTESHPELVTYFEGEMVSKDVSFYTQDKSWGATEDVDIQHWSRFTNWKSQLPVKKILDKSYVHKDPLSHANLYMRWKEQFLVPDAKQDDLEGASFAGFYYMSFNQLTGDISGLYYHRSSERFQQLELCHVPTQGVQQTFQFL